MMCLGWYNKTTCSVRPPVDVATGQPVTDSNVGTVATSQSGSTCPPSTWFWLTAAAIAVGGMLKK